MFKFVGGGGLSSRHIIGGFAQKKQESVDNPAVPLIRGAIGLV